MKCLVIGGGGREHAIAWKLAQSPAVSKLYAVPGNAGIAQLAECRSLPLEGDFSELLNWVEAEGIDLTVVGPEAPLVAGIVDAFQKRGRAIFGPHAQAAQLEGSKQFAKEFMARHRIPTARFQVFDRPEPAREYVRRQGAPIVVKASGLAAGKGAIVCKTLQEAEEAIERIMVAREFGDAGDRVVVEDFLQGEEASFTVFCDGERAVPLASSQDHKPIYEGDRGPNTGGMGAYSPAPVVDEVVHRFVMERIVTPALRGMAQEGRPYTGVLYVGLMITAEGPQVLEFNCRLGDPEAQAILPRLDSDLVPILQAALEGRLEESLFRWRPEAAVCVVMASGGYPGKYRTGFPIRGLEEAEAIEGVVLFHAGTKREDGQIVTAGGRVLGVTALGPTVREAAERAYRACSKITFQDAYYRRDIAYRALQRS
ncbi:MAG: phosphoribosylamine--glycine ligase [Candidatus Poribacteria bacterium]|nr:MAG: phosphoribosylamine--glycine ligase [Candidatus Poribacteria bacterium]